MREDCVRMPNGTYKVCYMFPAEVTVSKIAVPCCAAGFCHLYGMSSKTRLKYAHYVTVGLLAVEEGAAGSSTKMKVVQVLEL